LIVNNMVSHRKGFCVKRVEDEMKTDQDFQKNHAVLNSQIRCDPILTFF